MMDEIIDKAFYQLIFRIMLAVGRRLGFVIFFEDK